MKIKKTNDKSKVGMTHALQEWEDNDNKELKKYIKYNLEDKFLDLDPYLFNLEFIL